MSVEMIEDFISRFPIYQYTFITPQDIDFSEKVRRYCKRQCPHYRNSWSCPPAVGKVEKCKGQCQKYTDVLVFSTVTELSDASGAGEKQDAQKEHDRLTKLINDKMRDLGYLTYVLSSSYCKLCEKCTFPGDYCRFPDDMFPCIESHGITVSELMEDCGMDFYMGEKLHLLFSLIFFKDIGFAFNDKEEKENA